jgi:hypothetical protein
LILRGNTPQATPLLQIKSTVWIFEHFKPAESLEESILLAYVGSWRFQ